MLAEAQRLQTLAAMGIDVYLLRTRSCAVVGEPALSLHAPVAGANAASLAVVFACARGDDADTPRLRAALPLALGISATRITWIEPDAVGALASPPSAPAYLALGADVARALGAQLSTMQQNSAVIAVADAPRACMSNGLARRALWQALKPIARRLHDTIG
jgi:DNA polymerase III psi subunit